MSFVKNMETATNERRAKYLLPTRFYVVKILLSVFLSFTIKHYFETVFENSRDLSVTVQALAIVASLVVKTFRFFSLPNVGDIPHRK